jgi:hypothetical protein
MDYSPENAAYVLKKVEECLKGEESPNVKIQMLWAILVQTRARILMSALYALTGNTVFDGPFKGMQLLNDMIPLLDAPILLGCYEHELHPVVEQAIAADYVHILNIGCSVGYYAVGFARRMPKTIIEAFDILPNAQQICAQMAQLNGVQDRLHVSGLFSGEDFARYEGKKTLAFVDIEGEEINLLDPERYPALRKIDVIVELHNVVNPNMSKVLSNRFEGSHTVEIVENRNFLPDLSKILPEGVTLNSIDHLLTGWEGRAGLTPWGVFRVKP